MRVQRTSVGRVVAQVVVGYFENIVAGKITERVAVFCATFNVPRPPKIYIYIYIYTNTHFNKSFFLMCIILWMYTWQLKNREAVVTSQTTWVSARAYMLRLLHRRNKHDNSHYRVYEMIIHTYDRIWFVCDFLGMNVYIWNANLCSNIKGYK